MRLLLVEDHPDLAAMTGAYLRENGFVVDRVSNLSAAVAALDVIGYGAMVLDLGLPDGDGMKLFSTSLLGRRRLPPTVVLTARDTIDDRIAGLNAGADDYLVKPFSLDELLARLRAILRRPMPAGVADLSLGRLSFNSRTGEAAVESQALNLTQREAIVLGALLAARGRVVVRDVLEERLDRGNAPVTANALEALVSRLRKNLQGAGAGIEIEAVRGVGYFARLAARGEAPST